MNFFFFLPFWQGGGGGGGGGGVEGRCKVWGGHSARWLPARPETHIKK